MRKFWLVLIFLSSLFGSLSSMQETTDPIRFSLVSEENSLKAGYPVWVAIEMDIEDSWHSYWKNPGGDAGFPLQVDWKLPEGFTISELRWPYPKRLEKEGQFSGYGYEGKTALFACLTPPSNADGQSAKIEATVHWLVCSDSQCLPGETELSLEWPGAKAPASSTMEIKKNIPEKTWHIQARRTHDLLELRVQAPLTLDAAVTKALFFPAMKKTIDGKVEATISADPDRPEQYIVLLKEEQAVDSLQGVLVLQGKERVIKALDVDVLIHKQPSETAIGMAEPPKAIEEKISTPDAPWEEEDMTFTGGIALALLFAFLGGFLLNMMPCVLPVISFKVLSFVKMAGQCRKMTFKHGLAFSMGVILSFWLFAGVMLSLQSYGHSVGWGFQLQEPLFVSLLAALLFLFGLSLFGVFEFGLSMTSAAGQAEQSVASRSSGIIGSFFSGMLATAVATPCTGPFLGSAVGYAITLPPLLSLLIFTVLGLGMASPYLLLAAYPSLLRFLPKPGAWMTVFKELMGFFMLATVLWLAWVFAAQTSSLGIFLLLGGFLLLALAAWIYGRCCTPAKSKRSRLTGFVFASAFALVSMYTIVAASSPTVSGASSPGAEQVHQGDWEAFSPERLEQLRAEGTPVFIDFTAKWCLICQTNHMVLSTFEVTQKMQGLKVVKMKADWTRNDSTITKFLRKFGRSGVPLYVLYGKDPKKPPTILPQILTPEIVISSLNKL